MLNKLLEEYPHIKVTLTEEEESKILNNYKKIMVCECR